MFSFSAEMCPRRGPGSSCAWGGVPLSEGEGEWRAPQEGPNLGHGKDGFWDGLVHGIIPSLQRFGELL